MKIKTKICFYNSASSNLLRYEQILLLLLECEQGFDKHVGVEVTLTVSYIKKGGKSHRHHGKHANIFIVLLHCHTYLYSLQLYQPPPGCSLIYYSVKSGVNLSNIIYFSASVLCYAPRQPQASVM